MGVVNLDELVGATSTDEKGPMFNYHWALEDFPSIGGLTLPRAYCHAINIPVSKIAQDDAQIGATSVYFAGYSQISGFTMELFEDSALSSWRYIQSWVDLIQNPLTGGYRLPSQYKKNINVHLFNEKGDRVGTSTIRNVWPTGLQDVDLQGSAGELMRHSVEFVCDAQIIRFGSN